MESVFRHRRIERMAQRTLFAAMLIAAGMPAARAALLDPTQPYGTGERSAAPARGLQSTIVGAGDRRAVIDGRVYREGDRYGGAVVREIRAYEVILSESGKTRRLRLVPPLVRQPPTGQAGSNASQIR